MHGPRVARLLASLLVVMLGSAACDPCAGVADCTIEPHVTIRGRIIETEAVAAVRDVRVDVVRTGGARTVLDSTMVFTDAFGYFEASLGAITEGEGEVVTDVTVTSADAQYRVEGIRVPVVDERGDVFTLPTWVRRPYFPYSGEVWQKHDYRQRVVGAPVEFRRTGGVELGGSGWRPDDKYVARTDHNGNFPLFGRTVTTGSLDEVVGEVYIQSATGWRLLAPHRMRPTHLFDPGPAVIVFRGPPYFPYYGVVHLDGKPVRGVDVTFRRVSGVAGFPAEFTEYSTDEGRFSLRHFAPDTTGSVTFDLVFTSSPAGGPEMTPFTYRMTLPVREVNSQEELIGIFNVDRPADPLGTDVSSTRAP